MCLLNMMFLLLFFSYKPQCIFDFQTKIDTKTIDSINLSLLHTSGITDLETNCYVE